MPETLQRTFGDLNRAFVEGLIAYGAAEAILVVVRIFKSISGGPPAPGPLAIAVACVALVVTLALRAKPRLTRGTRIARATYLGARSLVSFMGPPTVGLVLIAGAPHMLVPAFPYAAMAIVIVVASSALLHICAHEGERHRDAA